MFASSIAFAAFLSFLLLASHLLFGLYARTTVGAVAADVARIGAADGRALSDSDRAALAQEARSRLGSYGDDADVVVALVDDDGDGAPDAVAVTITTDLPELLPTRWSDGATTISRTHRSRVEQFQGAP